MLTTAWDYTLEIIKLATDIDDLNNKLYKTDNIKEREILSSKVDALESQLFQLKNTLKDILL